MAPLHNETRRGDVPSAPFLLIIPGFDTKRPLSALMSGCYVDDANGSHGGFLSDDNGGMTMTECANILTMSLLDMISMRRGARFLHVSETRLDQQTTGDCLNGGYP